MVASVETTSRQVNPLSQATQMLKDPSTSRYDAVMPVTRGHWVTAIEPELAAAMAFPRFARSLTACNPLESTLDMMPRTHMRAAALTAP